MSQVPDEGPSPREMKRVDQFLDCVARLLAKRWLRDQRQENESPHQTSCEPQKDEA